MRGKTKQMLCYGKQIHQYNTISLWRKSLELHRWTLASAIPVDDSQRISVRELCLQSLAWFCKHVTANDVFLNNQASQSKYVSKQMLVCTQRDYVNTFNDIFG